jgi:hypothetical protein
LQQFTDGVSTQIIAEDEIVVSFDVASPFTSIPAYPVSYAVGQNQP